MRALIQRVKECKVEVKGSTVGAIGRGMLVLLGVGDEDSEKDCEYLLNKVVNLRIFSDDKGQMNLSLLDTGGSILVVSQFTLLGDCRKGRRPSFARAAGPEKAKILYEQFIAGLRQRGVETSTGRFQEMMDVHLINDGPVTLMIDSNKA